MLKSLALSSVVVLALSTQAMASCWPWQVKFQTPPQPQGPGPVQPQDPGLPTGPALPAVPAVSPDAPPMGQPEPRVKLYYRTCEHVPWRYVGCFECIHDAEEYARPLQAAGYQVHFRNCR